MPAYFRFLTIMAFHVFLQEKVCWAKNAIFKKLGGKKMRLGKIGGALVIVQMLLICRVQHLEIQKLALKPKHPQLELSPNLMVPCSSLDREAVWRIPLEGLDVEKKSIPCGPV